MVEERSPGVEALREELQYYKDLFQDVPFGWAYHEAVVDDAGEPVDYVFLRANKMFEEFTGLKRADILGRAVTEVIPGIEDAEPNLIKAFGYVALTGEPMEMELYFAPFDRWYRVVANCPRKGFFNAIFEEITSRKQAEDELSKTLEELARSNEDLEQFAYAASHDLQEPLRMVASYTELLAKRYAGKMDASADRFIGFAVEGATRMQHLIRDLLEFSRIGTDGKQPAPTDLNRVHEEVCHALSLVIEETGAEVAAGDLPTVLMDPVLARQLLQNLISNALKFCGERPPRVRITAARVGDRWEVTVADNGIGIAEEYHERIFGVFQRLHRHGEYPGTGIGLAVVRRIVERCDGEVRVHSVVGEGTTFTVALPAADEG